MMFFYESKLPQYDKKDNCSQQEESCKKDEQHTPYLHYQYLGYVLLGGTVLTAIIGAVAAYKDNAMDDDAYFL